MKLLENTITINNHIFRYLERKGSGPVLLFLHGLSDTSDQFLPIANLLPENWHILALDQRGHGGSWKPEIGYSPPDYAKDIKDFIDELGIGSLHIFGHSMGGRNAFVFASLFPKKIQSLIIGDIGPDENLNDIKETVIFFNSLPKSFNSESEAREHLEQRKPGYSDENLNILMKNLKIGPNGNLIWRYSNEACIASIKECRSRSWWEEYHNIQCPVLLFHVEGSTELPENVGKRMITEIQNVKYVKIQNSGHNFHLEQPIKSAEEIHLFIENL